MRVHVVGSVLTSFLGRDEQRVGRIGTVRDRLDETTDSEVVVGLLGLRRVDARQRGLEGTGVIVAQTNQRQVGQVAVRCDGRRPPSRPCRRVDASTS
jgi:hypothetical protein